MERGIELEPEAIAAYETTTFNKVYKVGWVEVTEPPWQGWVGCSPDGLIGETELIQVKCLAWNTHLEYIFSNSIESKYIKQMQFELFITGRQFNTLFSYHPGLRPFRVRLERDETMIADIKQQLTKAIDLVKTRLTQLTT
jgi:hypothetical protein